MAVSEAWGLRVLQSVICTKYELRSTTRNFAFYMLQASCHLRAISPATIPLSLSLLYLHPFSLGMCNVRGTRRIKILKSNDDKKPGQTAAYPSWPLVIGWRVG